MRVLAIDTSNLVLSVAVVDENRVLAEMTTNLQKNHSVRLMDCISLLLDETDTSPEQLNGIGVAKGPGSYTGVRIGVAAAKSMAWSLGIPAVGVSSLQAVAMNALGFSGGIIPLFDARRGQVYTGYYQTEGLRSVQEQMGERIVLLRDWLPMIREQAGGQPLLFLGDDVALHRSVIAETLGEQARFTLPSFNHPRAAHIGFLALERIRDGGSAHELVPEYLQVAEAEAKWMAQTKRDAGSEE
jgi:tRNA threonylcarbamoyladenosine biosynthesis protein TsaB